MTCWYVCIFSIFIKRRSSSSSSSKKYHFDKSVAHKISIRNKDLSWSVLVKSERKRFQTFRMQHIHWISYLFHVSFVDQYCKHSSHLHNKAKIPQNWKFTFRTTQTLKQLLNEHIRLKLLPCNVQILSVTRSLTWSLITIDVDECVAWNYLCHSSGYRIIKTFLVSLKKFNEQRSIESDEYVNNYTKNGGDTHLNQNSDSHCRQHFEFGCSSPLHFTFTSFCVMI